jgi:hypothetical protein
MPSCPKIEACGLHRCISMKEALRVWQSFYCDGIFTRCERFKLASAGAEVPERLLPNGRLQAEDEPGRKVRRGLFR